MGGRKRKGVTAEARFLPKGKRSWDIAEYVMYCHLCGALSETCNIIHDYDAVRLRTAFFAFRVPKCLMVSTLSYGSEASEPAIIIIFLFPKGERL